MSTSRTFTAGTSLPAASVNGLSQGTLVYQQTTASIGCTTSTDLLAVSATLVASRRLEITVEAYFQSTVAGDTALLEIREGATLLQQSQVYLPVANQAFKTSCHVILTPSAGSHTYKMTAARNLGTGTVTAYAAAAAPNFILVEDIGN
jgi:hypothetical protein